MSDKPPVSQQSLRYDATQDSVWIIDQTQLPHVLVERELKTLADACEAIEAMRVRGAPLIGVTAAFGLYLSLRSGAVTTPEVNAAVQRLAQTRPTAVNLQWALDRLSSILMPVDAEQRPARVLSAALELHAEDVAACAALGEHGAVRLENLWLTKCAQAKERGESAPSQFNVLTHCNAGALATVDWGTALAVVYKACERGVPVHVWVDETRPRNQGASLTCWELGERGVPHTLIVDNAGGHLMQHGLVDCCVVGSDRTTREGDVCNKIGTYLKALAAFDNKIPFYVALPVSTIDFELADGLREIPIEERSAYEVTHVSGLGDDGTVRRVRLTPTGTAVSNFGFDVTPARLVTGLITEHGVIEANAAALANLQARLSQA